MPIGRRKILTYRTANGTRTSDHSCFAVREDSRVRFSFLTKQRAENASEGATVPPIAVRFVERLVPGMDLMENFCAESEKDVAHMVAK